MVLTNAEFKEAVLQAEIYLRDVDETVDPHKVLFARATLALKEVMEIISKPIQW